MTSRKKQAIQTKQRIYEAAVSIMQKHGFEEATIEKICKKAKVSVGSFYVYYKSKEDVLVEVYASADQYFRDIVQPLLADLSYHDKVLTFFQHYALYNIKTGLDFVKRLYGSESKLFVARDRYMHQLLREILSHSVEAGQYRSDMSLDEAEQFLFIVARGVVTDWCLYEGSYGLEEKMAYYFRRILPVFFAD
jgi:TetR/AcrR family transcriptional regulator, fatty acid metabolism regulator protein